MLVTELTETVYIPRVNGNRSLPADDRIEVDLELPTAAQRNRWNRQRYQADGQSTMSFTLDAPTDEIITSSVRAIRRYYTTAPNGTRKPVSSAGALLESRSPVSAALVRELVNVVLFGDTLAAVDDLTEEGDNEAPPEGVAKNS